MMQQHSNPRKYLSNGMRVPRDTHNTYEDLRQALRPARRETKKSTSGVSTMKFGFKKLLGVN
ncbi:hypothetical protein BD779DRAFT_1491966 [Infundibulicybe gibba]|nr:hypothetical protein BD779DRAFT_1491966 [Infundibulicybe gibba]